MARFPIQGSGDAGGGGEDPLDTIVGNAFIEDEFAYTVYTGYFLERYNKLGTGAFVQSALNGVLNGSTIATAGERAGISSANIFEASPSESQQVLKLKCRIALNVLANRMILLAMTADDPGNQTTRAGILSNIPNGMGFIYDPADSANWQIFIKGDGGEQRTVLSGVSPNVVTSQLVNYEIIWDRTSGIVTFKIAGTEVGTLDPDDNPEDAHFMLLSIYNKTATIADWNIDYMQFSANRFNVIP